MPKLERSRRKFGLLRGLEPSPTPACLPLFSQIASAEACPKVNKSVRLRQRPDIVELSEYVRERARAIADLKVRGKLPTVREGVLPERWQSRARAARRGAFEGGGHEGASWLI